MLVYRIVKTRDRARDLSGKGAYIYGGRWNNIGTFMLYASINSSLAMLEVLVHTDESELPPKMFIAHIEVSDSAPIYTFPNRLLPKNWREPDNLQLKTLGSRLMSEKKYLGIRVRSAVLPGEYNILLNPLFPDFTSLVKIKRVDALEIDLRLL